MYFLLLLSVIETLVNIVVNHTLGKFESII
jgi:hypothetical protein